MSPAVRDRRARSVIRAETKRGGIVRVATSGGRAGRASFRYVSSDGAAIKNEAEIRRIRDLAIPPAWTDVWISEHPTARLQATGRDQRGRKQYLYHPAFRSAREASKFAALVAYGRALPAIRRQVDHDLRRRGLPREKVLATAVAILEATRIRIGNRKYAEANHSYGLTTLRPQQVVVDGGTVRFAFRGKSGRRHRIALHDRRLAAVVGRCRSGPGRELFQYASADGDWQAIHSDDVNAYLQTIAGTDVSAKTIRTWSASVLALRLLSEGKESEAAAPRSVLGQAIKAVAQALGNTAPVARASYVHPDVIDWFLAADAEPGPSRRGSRWLSPDERRLIRLLEAGGRPGRRSVASGARFGMKS